MLHSTVLLVEDNEDIREITASILTRLGFSVLQAMNGLEGLNIFRKKRVGLIISDVFMPEMNGNEFILKLAKYSDLPPIIMVSYNTFDFTPNPIISCVATKPMTGEMLRSHIAFVMKDYTGYLGNRYSY